jgi:hypothetical protein
VNGEHRVCGLRGLPEERVAVVAEARGGVRGGCGGARKEPEKGQKRTQLVKTCRLYELRPLFWLALS